MAWLFNGKVRLDNTENTFERYSRPVVHLAARMVPARRSHRCNSYTTKWLLYARVAEMEYAAGLEPV